MGQVGQTATATDGIDGRPAPGSRAGGMSLVFRAGPLLCAVALDEVIETMRPLAVQPLAGTAPFVRGISIVRGAPVPVIDVALLLSDREAPASRFVTIRTDRGTIALATGPVLGIRPTVTTNAEHESRLLGGAPARLVAAIGTVDTEPLIQLRTMQAVPDDVWAAAAAPPPDS